MADSLTLHGSCVSIDGRGVLILGEPGSGKSDLVLRLIDQPGFGVTRILRAAHLVADDQVVIRREADALIASAPSRLSGKLEVRGLGIVAVPAAEPVSLLLAVRLCPHQHIERLPEFPATPFHCLGMDLPLVLIDPSTASAPARIRAAIDHLGRP